MNRNNIIVICAIALILGGAISFIVYKLSNIETEPPTISSFSVSGIEAKIIGKKLLSAEIWSVPDNTLPGDPGSSLLGRAERVSVSDSGDEVWTLVFRKEPENIRLAARGIGWWGKESEILNFLIPERASDSSSNTKPPVGNIGTTNNRDTVIPITQSEITLKVGSVVPIGNGKISLERVYDDSRCPVGATCIWEGFVKADLIFTSDQTIKKLTLLSNQGPVTVDQSFKLTLKSASPHPNPDITIKPEDYIATFEISPLANDSISKNIVTSGIRGYASVGPSCPAVSSGNSAECADKPLKTTLRVENKAGVLIKEISTDPAGNFFIALPSGIYTIKGTSSNFPSLSPLSVEIKPEQVVNVTLSFDSGIR